MHNMTYIVYNFHREASLHVRNCEFLVHSVSTSQQQDFGVTNFEEVFGEASEPAFPVSLGGKEVSAPDPSFPFLDDLCGHGNTRGL